MAAVTSASSAANEGATSSGTTGSGRKSVRTASRLGSAVAAPKAENTAARSGTTTRAMPSARAIGTAKSGPHPP